MRSATTSQIAELYKNIRENWNDFQYAFDGVGELLVESLAPRERQVYEYFCKSQPKITPQIAELPPYTRAITAREIADHFQIEINNASSILKRLYSYGLLNRTLSQDESGIAFIYHDGVIR